MRMVELERCFAALDARLEVRATWAGAGLDRLLDEEHARLSGQVVELLRRRGWSAEVEVSFSRYGERGSIDVLAWHGVVRSLLVIEIKSELGSIEGLLRPLDAKARLAPWIARERFGWHARSTSRLVVMPEERTARRRVERHAGVLRVALPTGSRDVRAWLRQPDGQIAGIWFLSYGATARRTRNPSAVQRVRRKTAQAHKRGQEGACDT